MPCHPSHRTRFSWDASSYDEVCVYCGNTDKVPGGWGELEKPCPVSDDVKRQIDSDKASRNSVEHAQRYGVGS